MQYFTENFNPQEYDCITDLSGNERVTIMCHNKTKKLIVRKTINGANQDLYKQLIHIKHENLVQIIGLEKTDLSFYTYEEYINGKTLTEILSDGPVSEEKALNWIKALCKAVKLLHEQYPAIIHRDIKPGNIMLSSDGIIKLIDFDASKEFSSEKRRDTELVGTQNYAAPEQYGFAQSDPRTDIYAIGILFHELVTGYKPNEIPMPYAGKFKYIIQNCVELDPNRRYRSVQALERQLKKYGATGYTNNILGFRTGKWWKKIIASIIYIMVSITMISSFFAELELSGNVLNALSFPVFMIIFYVPLYLLIANFLHFRDNLLLFGSRFFKIKFVGIILYLLVWLLLNVIYSTLFAV